MNMKKYKNKGVSDKPSVAKETALESDAKPSVAKETALESDECIIRAQSLYYEYSAGTPFSKKAVDGVSFSIKRNRITGIIGHTGSGKSTLLQMLNGLLVPMSGDVLLDSESIFRDKKTLRQARFRVGLVFQYPEYQLFEETVRKDISFGPANLGLSEEETEKRVSFACGFTGLDEQLLDKSPFDLSGGQKRRVAIAGIIAMKPDVLILDEPASGLDSAGRRVVFDGLVNYKNSTGAAVVVVSHSMEDMAKYADEVIVMAQGRMIASGSVNEVFSDRKMLTENSLEAPVISIFADELRDRLAAKGIDFPKGIYTVEAALSAITALLGKEGMH